MGKDKAGGKGAKGASTRDIPPNAKTGNDVKPTSEPDPNVGATATATTNDPKSHVPPQTGGAPTPFGHAHHGNTRHDGGDPRRDLPAPSKTVEWFNFHSGDMQVFVAETHVFRVHQEILAAHSKFFQEQLQVSVDSSGLVTAPRSQDIPVVVLRDICADAFIDVLHLIYPRPGGDAQPAFTTMRAEQLLQTAHALGMPKVLDAAMRMLVSDSTPVAIYQLARDFSPKWQLTAIRELVYRTRPLSDEEAEELGVVTTARVARLREEFRARIFSRFEPVVKYGPNLEAKPHRSGEDSELVRWSTFGTRTEARPELGKCQQAILEALKVIFNSDELKDGWARYVIREDASVMRNLVEWLRLGKVAGGASLCKGCMASVEKAARLYCRKDEMDELIEKEIEVILNGYPEFWLSHRGRVGSSLKEIWLLGTAPGIGPSRSTRPRGWSISRTESGSRSGKRSPDTDIWMGNPGMSSPPTRNIVQVRVPSIQRSHRAETVELVRRKVCRPGFNTESR